MSENDNEKSMNRSSNGQNRPRSNENSSSNSEHRNQNGRVHSNNNVQNGGGRIFRTPKGRKSIAYEATVNIDKNMKNGQYSLDTVLLNSVEKNRKIQDNRLTPWKKIRGDKDKKITFIPLGGLCEIGGNMAVIETKKEAIVIDCGMSFPDETMHGVDILVPNFSYLHQIKDKIVGLIITHAHEDHIGAVPYLFKEIQIPVFGTALPLGMIVNKFDEHKLKEAKKMLNPIEKRVPYKIGNDFEIEWIHMTHSIADSSSLAIKTDAGVLFHTGDFKIDHTPIDGYPTDLQRISYYGAQGVLAMFSDSTNSYKSGITPSESIVRPVFERIFANATGRVLLSTFSSNIHRIFQAMQVALKYNRKICIIGRSMERNLQVAMRLKYLQFDTSKLIDADEIANYPDNEVLVITTGSQGEGQSALFRMSINEHRQIFLKPNDLVVLSSKAIPGNEGSVSKLLNNLMKKGVKVEHEDPNIHASGHASQEEQKLLLRLVQPKFFLPIHGEYNHLVKHAKTAMDCGIDEKRITLLSDGKAVEICPVYNEVAVLGKKISTGKVFVDNQSNDIINKTVVTERQKLADEGLVNVFVLCDDTGKALKDPFVNTFGLLNDGKSERVVVKKIKDIYDSTIETRATSKPDFSNNLRSFIHDLRKPMRRYFERSYKKLPHIEIKIIINT